VFKIQANMDPAHRDRIAFLRLCAGKYARGMRLFHVRLDKEVRVADALTFMAAERAHAEEACAGDIIGLHNHGTINIATPSPRASGSLSPGCRISRRRYSAVRCSRTPSR